MNGKTLLKLPYIFGAVVPGPLHLKIGLPCQDAYAYKIISPDCGVIAVSDGLGSASKAEIGSKLAVKSSVKKAETMISIKGESDLGEVVEKSVIAARKRLEKEANKEDMACTLIIVAFCRDEIGIAHIGDGAVVAKTRKEIKLVSKPEESEYINEVVPLTSGEWKKHLRITTGVKGVLDIAIFTDGCQRAAIVKTENELRPYDKFFNPLFSYAENLKDIKEGGKDIKRLLTSQKLSENCEDDKTLIIGVLQREKSRRQNGTLYSLRK